MVLGLHCAGSNGSTTFTDIKGHSISAVGNAQISTAQFKVGSSSGIFDGAGDYLNCGDSADFELGSGDFNLRALVRMSGYSPGFNGAYAAVIVGKDQGSGRAYHWKITGTATSWDGVTFSTAGSEISASVSLSNDTWYDMEVDKHGTEFRFYIDGIQQGATLTHSTSIADVATELTIGGILYFGFEYHFPGYIQEVQIFRVSRHTTDFTPLDHPFFDFYEPDAIPGISENSRFACSQAGFAYAATL